MKEPAICPSCGQYLDISFPRPFKDIAHMIIGNEWLSLESFPVLLKCTSCPWQRETVGHEMTIDMQEGVILFARIDKPEGQ